MMYYTPFISTMVFYSLKLIMIKNSEVFEVLLPMPRFLSPRSWVYVYVEFLGGNYKRFDGKYVFKLEIREHYNWFQCKHGRFSMHAQRTDKR